METTTQAAPPVVINGTEQKKGLSVAIAANIIVMFGGVVAENAEKQVELLRKFVRNAILRQFGIREIAKENIVGGRCYLNDVYRKLKLPPVKETTDGKFAETLEQYTERVMPELQSWLKKSVQMAGTTLAAANAVSEKL